MEVNASSLPETGISAEAIELNVNSYIDLLRLAGLQQDENQIRIITDAGPITLKNIGRRENTGPNSVRFWYDSARWGNRTAISWEYQLPSAQVAGIRTTAFQLSDIDTMRERIFAATPNNTPFDEVVRPEKMVAPNVK